MTELAAYERDGGIATITMDDGKVNAFSIPMLRAVHAALDRAEQDRTVVVLTGREHSFSAGFDLTTFASSAEQVVEMLRLGAQLTERVLSFPTPVVVACTGHAVAAGTFPVFAADARIGVDGPFRIGLNEVRIGLPVPTWVIELARQRLHPARFDRAVVTATMHSPAEAVAAGFLDRVVAPGELRDASLDTAAELAQLNADAHAATKRLARAGALQAIRSALEHELTLEALAGAHAPAA